MPPKRTYNKSRRKTAKKYGATVAKANVSASAIQAAVRRTLFKNAETKQAQITSSDYQQIGHNSFVNIDNSVLATTQGVGDGATTINNRIGDEITLLNAKFCMMLELNERYSDVTYRILVVKSARGDVPTTSTLFNGLSGNKMLDTINYERYSILYQKWGKIKATNMSMGNNAAESGTITGIYTPGPSQTYNFNSRATKIVKFQIDGKKFYKNGIVKYDAGGDDGKFYDFSVLIYAYSNYTTSSALGYNVLAVNDYYHLLNYKDM